MEQMEVALVILSIVLAAWCLVLNRMLKEADDALDNMGCAVDMLVRGELKATIVNEGTEEEYIYVHEPEEGDK